jgi:hypothetical protein
VTKDKWHSESQKNFDNLTPIATSWERTYTFKQYINEADEIDYQVLSFIPWNKILDDSWAYMRIGETTYSQQTVLSPSLLDKAGTRTFSFSTEMFKFDESVSDL